ncbi:MAG: hydroxymethylglutaryl-CoA lyase [Minwuiales bacterium]|nr:hydroxymethylglutaryl-CoA lyase [Minwuiales bacterium]
MATDIDVKVREVGLRDGLQSVQAFFPTASKVAWIEAEAAAGVPEIEVCSFVPAKVIPQFTDAVEVVEASLKQPGLEVSALIPNKKGAERGFEVGVHKLNYVTSVSESHNMANVRRTVADSVAAFREIARLRDENPDWRNVKLAGGLSTAFGCTIEGPVDPAAVLKLAQAYVEAGADELTVADTVGYANPAQVKEMFVMLKRDLGDVPLAGHFHDTRGLGLANVHAALEAGVREFDASLAGLGGCPFAPGATGNIVMDDLVFMLEAMGLKTGVDLDRLVAVRDIVARELPDEPLYGAIARAKPPKGFRPAGAAPQAAE